MRIEGITLLAVGALFATSCTKPPPPPPPPTPTPKPAATPKPVPTPHPATGAREAAVRLYPDLAKKDSIFNRTFLEVLEDRRQKYPESLTEVDWPLEVAHRTAAILQVLPQSPTPPPRPSTPVPPPPPPPVEPTPRVVRVAPNPPNALERGAYNQKREVAKPPVIRPY